MEGATRELPRICVVVRKRPMSRKEVQKNDVDILERRGPRTMVVREFK